MWSGCAGSRTFQQSGVACKGSLGGWQGGHRRRWLKPTVRQEITCRDHRGWSPHMTRSRNKPAKPNRASDRSFITSGEIGTNTTHPPGKRSMGINYWQNRIDTCGPASAAWTSTKPYRYARADEEFLINPLPTNQINLTTRRRVECGVDVPGAGHFSRQILEASGHSAAARAGTVVDGQYQEIGATQPRRDHRGWSPHMTT